VVTYSEKENFSYSKVDDQSGDVSQDIFLYNAIKIAFSKGWHCGDSQTEQAYTLAVNNFKSRNQNRDTHFSFYEGMHIAGYKEKVLSIVDLTRKTSFMHWSAYLIVSLFLMSSLLYRLWLEKYTVKANFHLEKVVYI